MPRPGGPVDDHVIEGLAAYAGRLHGDTQVLAYRGLADKIVEAGRPEADVLFPVVALGRGRDRTRFGVGGAIGSLCGGHNLILGAVLFGGQP